MTQVPENFILMKQDDPVRAAAVQACSFQKIDGTRKQAIGHLVIRGNRYGGVIGDFVFLDNFRMFGIRTFK